MMDFNFVVSQLKELKNKPLAGASAHNRVMDLNVRRQIFEDVNHKHSAKQAAVLALIYPDEHQRARMVFILRKTYNGAHSGQIAFPGGKMEKIDTSLQETALRETQEEIGIEPDIIQIQRALSPIFIPISNYKVQPFLGLALQTLTFKPDPVEVDRIFEMRFKDILKSNLTPLQHSYFGKNYTLHAFDVKNIKIWGATAMILSEIVHLFNE